VAVASSELEIESPCPITLSRELSDGRYRAWDCSHCQKTVHVLSAMTEREARVFLKHNEGKNLCITYMAGEDGEIRFQPERVVPVSRLVRRRTAVAAAATMAAALAACTPTQPDTTVDDAPVTAIELESPTARTGHTSMADLVAEARDKAKTVEAEKDEPCETEETVTNVEPGGTPIPDPTAVPMPGGIGVPEVAPRPTPVAKPPKVVHKRGGRRIKRLPPVAPTK